jgi:hypothetical protein
MTHEDLRQKIFNILVGIDGCLKGNITCLDSIPHALGLNDEHNGGRIVDTAQSLVVRARLSDLDTSLNDALRMVQELQSELV